MDWIEIIALVVCVSFVVWGVVYKRKSPKQLRAAERLLMSLSEYEVARLEQFQFLDLAFYDDAQAAFEGLGYRLLGNLTDRRIGANSPVRTFVRVMVSSDGADVGAIFHLRFRGPLKILLWVFRVKEQRVVEQETEFSDGTFLNTTLADARIMLAQPSAFQTEHMPADTTVRQLCFRHSKRVAERLKGIPDVATVTITTLEEAIASQRRGEWVKVLWRRKLGGLTRDELVKLAPCGMQGDTHHFYDELLQERERNG